MCFCARLPAQPVQPAQWNLCCLYFIGVKCVLSEIRRLFNRDGIFLSHSIGACPVQFFAKEERSGFNQGETFLIFCLTGAHFIGGWKSLKNTVFVFKNQCLSAAQPPIKFVTAARVPKGQNRSTKNHSYYRSEYDILLNLSDIFPDDPLVPKPRFFLKGSFWPPKWVV